MIFKLELKINDLISSDQNSLFAFNNFSSLRPVMITSLEFCKQSFAIDLPNSADPPYNKYFPIS